MNNCSKISDAVYFDPNPNTPYIMMVDELLGYVGRIIHANDDEQFANYGEENSKLYTYSPALKMNELEVFAKQNIEKYKTINAIFKDEIDESLNFDIFPFWDKSEAWARHPILHGKSFAILQAIYDTHKVLVHHELSSCLMLTKKNQLKLRFHQRSNFGNNYYIPFRNSPFEIHFPFDLEDNQYKVEGIWSNKVKANDYTFDDHGQTFKFQGSETIVEGSVLFTANKPQQLRQVLKHFLDGYDLNGIVEG